MGVTVSTANAGATYEPILSQTLVSNSPTVTFSSIPSTYTDFKLVANLWMASPSGTAYIIGRVGNGSLDTGSNYSSTVFYGDGTNSNSYRTGATNYHQYDTYLTGSIMATLIMDFMSYANTAIKKSFIGRTSSAGKNASAITALWGSTSAINTISIYDYSGNSFAAGSTFTLYGIKAA